MRRDCHTIIVRFGLLRQAPNAACNALVKLQVRPSPPSWATAGNLPALSAPRGGAFANFVQVGGGGGGYLPTPSF